MKFTAEAKRYGWTDTEEDSKYYMQEEILDSNVRVGNYKDVSEVIKENALWVAEFTAEEIEQIKAEIELRKQAIEDEWYENLSCESYDGPDYMERGHEIIEMERLGWTA